MKIALTDNLKELAKEFKKHDSTLFVVGGYVRNALLGRFDTDIDLAGPSSMEEVQDIARSCGWRTQVVNQKLGTLLLSKNNDHYEYSCFRTECYNVGGEHSPSSVKFVKDIKTDASRRDFTVNALYYDIVTEEIHDFYNGLEDLKRKTLVAVESPEHVFANDGLRLLRMVRQVGDFGFKIEKNTLKVAMKNSYMLKDISKERILYELIRISCSDYLKSAIRLLNKMKLWKYITNLPSNFKLPINNMIVAVEKAPLEWTFEFFMCAIMYRKMSGNLNSFNNLSFHIDQIIGNNGLRASKKTCAKIRELYHLIYIFLNDNAPLTSAQKYFTLRDQLKPSFIALDRKKELLLSTFINTCLQNNVPLTVDQLEICSDKMLAKGISSKNISTIKQILVYNCLNGSVENNEEALLHGAKKLDKYLNDMEKKRPGH